MIHSNSQATTQQDKITHKAITFRDSTTHKSQTQNGKEITVDEVGTHFQAEAGEDH